MSPFGSPLVPVCQPPTGSIELDIGVALVAIQLGALAVSLLALVLLDDRSVPGRQWLERVLRLRWKSDTGSVEKDETAAAAPLPPLSRRSPSRAASYR